ncbi:ABC transporter ATP-binding protein/permease [Nocardia sp. NPDC049149]|uniref:ABC transporter ATP-binding protein/permease n=1 Tax=Nocardia sp. NPDC049149 TaxID=3364315 RepID=UPI0037154E7A
MLATRDWSDVLAESARWVLIAFACTCVTFLVCAVVLLRTTKWGKQFRRVTGAYFTGRTALRSCAYAAALLFSAVLMVRVQVLLSYQGNDMFTALQKAAEVMGRADQVALDAAQRAFVHSLAMFGLLAVVDIARTQLDFFLGQHFEIDWRRWLTEHVSTAWIDDRAYYRTRFIDDPIDNPDQRIQQDVGDMISSTRALSLGAVTAVLSVVSFTKILWELSAPLGLFGIEIPRAMVFLLFTFVLIATSGAFWIGRPLIRLGFDYQAATAHFRYALVRLRDNAERVAFYRGEATEKRSLLTLFTKVLSIYHGLVLRTTWFIGWNQAANEVAVILPWLLQSPQFFAGKLTLGDVQQTTAAFGHIQNSLSFFRNSYRDFAAFRATLMRLDGLRKACAQAHELPAIGARTLDDAVELDKVMVARPDGNVLIADLRLRLRAGDAVVIKGRSGSGKTTLLRAIAELWPYTSGIAGLPADAMFLSQLPYLPLGDLRSAATYPATPDKTTDAALGAALAKVRLDHLVPRLDETADWASILSPGEQQRLAFARIILLRPAAAFLDEATSAVDEELEFALYRLIRTDLPDLIVVSTAHRATVDQHHTARLVLDGVGGWSLEPNKGAPA